MIRIKRVYETIDSDQYNVLVYGLWPRGIKKSDLHYDLWAKDIAPSSTLRKWFNHDKDKFETFAQHYKEELEDNDSDTLNTLIEKSRTDDITLLYAARDTQYNHAVVLKSFLDEKD